MLNIAVCDDSQQDLALICRYLKNYQTLHKEYEFHVDAFPCADALQKALKASAEYKLYFLNISPPEKSGILLANYIRSHHLPGLIVFLASSPDDAMNAFRLKAMQYLLKPIPEAALFEVLDDAALILPKLAARYLMVSMTGGRQQLHFSSIAYVECKNRVLHFHLTDGQILTSRSIRQSFEAEVLPLLNDVRFCRPHQSFIINMHCVSRLHPAELIMQDGSRIPVSKKRGMEMRTAYLKFLSN